MSNFHKTAAFHTLGCKLNFAETSAIGRSLLEAGFQRAKMGENADICIINTCSVRERPVQKLFSEIGQFNKKKKTGMYILMALITVLVVFPFIWMLILSFKSNSEILSTNSNALH